MTRHLVVLSTALLLATVVGCSRPEPAAPPATTPPRFLASFHGTYANLAYVSAPHRHAQRLLGGVAQAIARLPAPLRAAAADHLATVRSAIEEHRRWIPEELAFGVDEPAVAAVGRAGRAVLYTALASSLPNDGDTATSAERERLRAALLGEVSGISLRGATAWARFADESTARDLERRFVELAQAKLPGDDDVGVATTFVLADVVGPEVLTDFLASLSMVSGRDNPLLPSLLETIGGIELRIALRRRGSELRIVVGEDGTGSAASAPRELCCDSDALVAWARIDLRRLNSELSKIGDVYREWKDTAAGRALQAADTQDILGGLLLAEAEAAAQAKRGEYRLTFDDAALTLRRLERGAEPGVGIGASGIAALVPEDSSVLSIEGTASLASGLQSGLMNIETRLVEADDSGDSASYYQHFATLRALVFEESLRHYRAPTALVARRGEHIDHLEIQVEGGTLAVDELPLTGLAVVTGAADPAAALAFTGQLATALCEGVSGVTAEPGESAPAAAPEAAVDALALGVPSRRLPLPCLEAALGEGNSVSMEGSVTLHAFALGEFVVVSTGLELSRAIIAQHRAGPRSLPVADAVDYGFASGAEVAAMIGDLEVWLDRLRERNPALGTIAEAAVPIVGVVRSWVAEVHMEAWSREQGEVRVSETALRFRPARAPERP